MSGGQMSLLRTVAFLLVASAKLQHTAAGPEILREPAKLYLEDGSFTHVYVAATDISIPNDYGNTLLSFTTRVYCLGTNNGATAKIDRSSCGVPGPTWVVTPGTTVNIVLHNLLKGVGVNQTELDAASEDYIDADITNLHTHGLHVDPRVDNIIDIFLQPICNSNKGINITNGKGCVLEDAYGNGDSHTYKYEILDIHYPGTHWYHPHWHGSTSLHVAGGQYGTIIVEPLPELAHWEPAIPEENDHVLLVSWSWLHNATQCLEYVNSTACPNTGSYKNVTYKTTRGKSPLDFPIHGLCEIYCRFYKKAYFATVNSDVEYNVAFSDGVTEIESFVVNAMFQPTLEIVTNEWHRLRITNTHMSYLLFEFNTTKQITPGGEVQPFCQMWVISTDGVYFDTGPRAMFKAPYNDTIVIPPGGRAEVLVNCLVPGNYAIYASDDTRFETFQYAPVPTETTLIMFVAVSGPPLYDLLDKTNCEDWGDELPCEFQPKVPYSPYLSDTLNASETRHLTSLCVSPYSNENQTADSMTQCNLVLERKKTPNGPVAVNNIQYDKNTPLTSIESGVTHEWLVTSNFHPFHQHTYTYQIQRDIVDGWLGQKGDWRDTLGSAGSFVLRTNLFDFYTGKLATHCHFVPHEDHGMMAWHNLTDLGRRPALTASQAESVQKVEKIEKIETELLNIADDSGIGHIVPSELSDTPIVQNISDEERVNNCTAWYFWNDEWHEYELNGMAVIDSIDVDTKLLLYLRVFEYTDGFCYLGILPVVELRDGVVDNFWIGFGFGGQYQQDISNISMTGDALIYSIQAEYAQSTVKVKKNPKNPQMTDQSEFVNVMEVNPVSRVGVLEATLSSDYTVSLDASRDVVCSNYTLINDTMGPQGAPRDSGADVKFTNLRVHWFCVKPLKNNSVILGSAGNALLRAGRYPEGSRKKSNKRGHKKASATATKRSDAKMDRDAKDLENINFIWSYGEGQYKEYGMHSARGACTMKMSYNQTSLEVSPQTVSYTFCLHEQNIITESGVQSSNDVVVQGLSRGITASGDTFMKMSGYERYVQNNKNNDKIESKETKEEMEQMLSIDDDVETASDGNELYMMSVVVVLGMLGIGGCFSNTCKWH